MTIGIVGATASSGASTTASTPTNTITYAEEASDSPDYIFPYMACQYFYTANINQLQYMMYRPLYWYGTPGSSAVDFSLSTGNKPVFTNGNKTATVTMKGWKFTDGQVVDAQSVMFFLNMYKSDPTGYCGYSKGYGIPDQVASASAKGNVLTINFTRSVNPNWILYNYLSELTPMPNSWDVTAPGKTSTCTTGVYGAAATDRACNAVIKYLDKSAVQQTNFPGSFWQSGVDGPWKLTAFDDLGDATFIPNKSYSGPVKAQPGIKYVKLLAFTSDTSEETALRGGTVDIGYVDPSILTGNAKAPGVAGANWPAIANNYTLSAGPLWETNYAPFNFSKTDPKYAVVSQPYIRQAMELAVDSAGIIKKVFRGYAYPTDSPLPPGTPTSISGLTSTAGVKNPYPFNLAKAKALLVKHGWKLNPSGVRACEKPGKAADDCGAGIAKGTTLNFSIVTESGSASLSDMVAVEESDWDSIGFSISKTERPVQTVVGDCTAATDTKYEICPIVISWTYTPDVYPSGEVLWASGGASNVGAYSNSIIDADIKATTFGSAKLSKYATDLAKQVPAIWEPEESTVIETVKTLKSLKINGVNGFVQDPLQNFMPEYLHY
jgi:peptide/nickel transport system substrate-binding protein